MKRGFCPGPVGLAALAAVTPDVTLAYLGPVRLFDLGGAIAASGLLGVFVVSAWRNTRALYAAEPVPVRSGAPTLSP